MALKTHQRILGVALVSVFAGLVYCARSLFACGPWFEIAAFAFRTHPDFPLDKFAQGKLGVLQPTYRRLYLFVAYRDLIGTGFSQGEIKALFAPAVESPGPKWQWSETLNRAGAPWVLEWLEARKKIPGVGPPPDIRVYKIAPGEKQQYVSMFSEFLNCNADAFRNAITTLNRRVEKFGADSAVVKDWIQAQDQVFANCSGGLDRPWLPRPKEGQESQKGPFIPVVARSSDPPLLRADRAYQIAAAHFYAGDFGRAKEMFETISRDESSPWKEIAFYLVARALIRKATLATTTQEPDRGLLAQAESQLVRVLGDKSLARIHPGAQALLNFVRARLYPDERLRELAQLLMKKNSEKNLSRDWYDYNYLFSKVGGHLVSLDRPEGRKDDLSDWIVTFSTSGQLALDHSIQKWEETSSLPWLVASLSKIDTRSPELRKLLEAADQIKEGSPAYATVAYHRVRLMVEAGKEDEARAALDKLMARGDRVFPRSSLNLLLAMRMGLARDLDEFLRFAPRVPAGLAFDMGMNDEVPGNFKGEPSLFDADSADILDQRMPLVTLKSIAENKILPQHLRREIALAAWVRSVLVEDETINKELVPVLQVVAPELKGDLGALRLAKGSEAEKFAAAYLILRFPGMRPYIVPASGRKIRLDQIDNFHENWWAKEGPCGLYWEGYRYLRSQEKQKGSVPVPRFLTESQTAMAKKELEKLSSVSGAPTFLSRYVVTWARNHPKDPRVPEALHLAVKSGRYGCKDDETSKFSKAAFELLHRRYPKSEWAAKTKYWYQ